MKKAVGVVLLILTVLSAGMAVLAYGLGSVSSDMLPALVVSGLLALLLGLGAFAMLARGVPGGRHPREREAVQDDAPAAPDRVTRNTVVTVEYSVRDGRGQAVDMGEDVLTYLHGGYGEIFPALEKALGRKHVGDALNVTLKPADAFGEIDPRLVRQVPRQFFPAELPIGSEPETPYSGTTVLPHRVVAIRNGQVVLDANHPLAGLTLTYTCRIAAVRPATPAEIAAGAAAV